MHAKTALAVAGTVLAVPSAALAATADDESTSTDRDALHPSGKLTHDEGLKDRLVRTNIRLSRRLDRKPRARRLQTLPVSVLRERNRRLRTRVSRLKPATPPHLQAIAACESGGNPSTNTGNGFYGKYQFSAVDVARQWAARAIPPPPPRPSRTSRAAVLYARTALVLARLRPVRPYPPPPCP